MSISRSVMMAVRCPITLLEMDELEFPVAFASAPEQPYELDALCVWFQRSLTNPLTGLAVGEEEELVPVGGMERRLRTAGVLSARSLALLEHRVLFFSPFFRHNARGT